MDEMAGSQVSTESSFVEDPEKQRVFFSIGDDLAIMRSVLRENPFLYKSHFKNVLEEVNTVSNQNFSYRAVRSRAYRLIEKFKKDDAIARRSSGTEEEKTELTQLLTDASAMMREALVSGPIHPTCAKKASIQRGKKSRLEAAMAFSEAMEQKRKDKEATVQLLSCPMPTVSPSSTQEGPQAMEEEIPLADLEFSCIAPENDEALSMPDTLPTVTENFLAPPENKTVPLSAPPTAIPTSSQTTLSTPSAPRPAAQVGTPPGNSLFISSTQVASKRRKVATTVDKFLKEKSAEDRDSKRREMDMAERKLALEERRLLLEERKAETEHQKFLADKVDKEHRRQQEDKTHALFRELVAEQRQYRQKDEEKLALIRELVADQRECICQLREVMSRIAQHFEGSDVLRLNEPEA